MSKPAPNNYPSDLSGVDRDHLSSGTAQNPTERKRSHSVLVKLVLLCALAGLYLYRRSSVASQPSGYDAVGTITMHPCPGPVQDEVTARSRLACGRIVYE